MATAHRKAPRQPRLPKPLRLIEYEYRGNERLPIIGSTRDGSMLDLVAVPAADPARIIHADNLRPSFHDYLR